MTTPKERPILFSGEMVRAILSGRKSQTRRVVKPQPPGTHRSWNNHGDDDLYFFTDHPTQGEKGKVLHVRCPYQPGMRLWVRETWRPAASIDGPRFDAKFPYGRDHIYYRADQTDVYAATSWRPAIFMPRWAARILLQIVDVRVERLQDISETDAIAEGLATWQREEGAPIHYGINRADIWEQDPLLTFKRLWDSINGPLGHGWDSNPWVWAVTFQRVDEWGQTL